MINFFRGEHIVPFRGEVYDVITKGMPPAPPAGAGVVAKMDTVQPMSA
ncbi:MAG TPA: hypothetical protein VJ785_07370 [Anaerolineales bacterium]|nr:hypothetical protein [Anaerolineales bacterium]